MKYFLLSFIIKDGEHEHYDHITTQAVSESEARAKGEAQTHEVGEIPEEDQETMFDFGDGETSSELHNCKEISREEMESMDKLGVAHFYEL